jgi:hypothetical protein
LSNYKITIKGKGVNFFTNGDNYIEYEIEEMADIEAHFTADIGLRKGKWKFVDYSLREDGSKQKITNIIKYPKAPAYKSLANISLKEIMAGPHISEDISINNMKYLNNIKGLVLFRLGTVSKEELVKEEVLTNLFSKDEGKAALTEYYNLKQTMNDYYLDSVKFRFGSKSRVSEGETGRFDLTYSVKRTASKELFKKAKSNGATKKQLAIIKYPAKGYYDISMRVSIINGFVVISEFTKGRNHIDYTNGGPITHPLSIAN